jgi:hypothetical protein
MSNEETQYSVIDEVEQLNEQFQSEASYGGVSLNGIAGFHSLFNHDAGINFAGHTALHAALDEVLMEVALDPDIVEQNHGEVTPEAMAEDLQEQLTQFTQIGAPFARRLTSEFESKLQGYEEDLQDRADTEPKPEGSVDE